MAVAGLIFRKMHGLGNDFMVFNALDQQVMLSADEVRALADRHRGVGFDQLLLVERPTQPGVDFRYRIFNADGSEVAQCGNGARCFARFVRETGLSAQDALTVETASGVIVLHHEGDGVRVNMGAPRFAPAQVPLTLMPQADQYEVLLGEEALLLGAVSMGNPHAVLLVDDVDTAEVARLGPSIQARRDLFPEGVNVGFAQVVSRDHLRLRVYERGAGETQACGTGACAAMAVCRRLGRVSDQVRVQLPGGELLIRWSGVEGEPLWMTGPAQTVFEGRLL